MTDFGVPFSHKVSWFEHIVKEIKIATKRLFSPRATGLLFTCLRPKGLRMFSKSKFCAEFKNQFLNRRKCCVLGEKSTFLKYDAISIASYVGE